MGKQIEGVEQLRCVLTEEELGERGREVAGAIQRRAQIVEEKREAMAGYTRRLDAESLKMTVASAAINNRWELRDVQTLTTLNSPRSGMKTILRVDTGEFLREETMTNLERQEQLNFEKANAKG